MYCLARMRNNGMVPAGRMKDEVWSGDCQLRSILRSKLRSYGYINNR